MSDRWRSGLAGFLASAVVPLLLCLWLFLGAAGSLEAQIGPATPAAEDRRLLLEHRQMVAGDGVRLLLIVLLPYWILSSALGRGAVVGVTSANILLALGLLGQLMLMSNAWHGWIPQDCHVLPYPHEGFQLARVDECPSSSTFLSAVADLSLLLILVSLAARILGSRKKASFARPGRGQGFFEKEGGEA